uniref:Organomercury resistance protein n=2 Tax=Pseudomonadota TaxID=1224 RepID=K4J2A5_BURCE|nr:organomercury resistance protein [Burkholderia cepacia]CAC14701.1 merG protein [Pseudomonas sp. ED23-33]
MFCDIRLKLRRVRACLTIVLASTATLGMPNQALAAYDFSKLGAAIETLSPETVSDWEKKARAGDAMAQNIMGLAYKCGMGVKQNHAASIQWFAGRPSRVKPMHSSTSGASTEVKSTVCIRMGVRLLPTMQRLSSGTASLPSRDTRRLKSGWPSCLQRVLPTSRPTRCRHTSG